MAQVLVIEDEDETRHLLRDVLRREGHDVREACHGFEGISQYRASPADLVITDLLMPEKDGLETIAELRGEFPTVKIIAMAGVDMNAHLDLLTMAKKLGAVATLRKPFEMKDLLRVVEETVGS